MNRHFVRTESHKQESIERKRSGSVAWNDCGIGIPVNNAEAIVSLKGLIFHSYVTEYITLFHLMSFNVINALRLANRFAAAVATA